MATKEDQNKIAIEAQQKGAVKALKAAGVEHFILAVTAGDLYSTHTEAMPPAVTSRIVISLFKQFIDHQVSITGDRPEYQAAVMKLGEDFSALLRAFNAKVATPTQE